MNNEQPNPEEPDPPEIQIAIDALEKLQDEGVYTVPTAMVIAILKKIELTLH